MNKEESYKMIAAEVLIALGYFDYFEYPLSREQLLHFLSLKVDDTGDLDVVLVNLENAGKLFCRGQFYALQSVDSYVQKRKAGEERFAGMQGRIAKTARMLSRFPFIKFAGLSGSLSKGYAPPGADIDLFIITTKNRLWICRTLLHLMKKMSFLKGSQHFYCMNYFVDESALLIEEQNFFTAIELSTLRPLVDEADYYLRLMRANEAWLQRELPNMTYHNDHRVCRLAPFSGAGIIKALSSDGLNRLLMRLTDMKWRRKWKHRNYPEADYELAFKTKVSVSKNHLHNYQKKLLRHLELLKQQ